MKCLKLKYSKLIIITFSVLLFTSIISESVAKANYFSGGRKNNADYFAYYDSSVSSFGYSSNYDTARSYWNASSVVNITRTFSLLYTPDIYYVDNTATSGLLGQVIPYDSSENVVGASSYWDHTHVFIYDNQMEAQSPYTTAYINYNASHEVGHTIKMAHTSPPISSVMIQGWYSSPSSLSVYDSGEADLKW